MSAEATNSRLRDAAHEAAPAWRWSLESGARRARFFLIGAGILALYTGIVLADYAAKVFATSLSWKRVKMAARLDPMNAAYDHILGRIAFYERQDVTTAIEYYGAATRKDPYSARYWLDLANAQQIAARPEDSRHSLERALAADPTNPSVANEAANYYLVLGDVPAALRLLALVVRYSPEDARAAVDLSWRATQDVHAVVEQVLPRTPDAYLMFLQLLMSRHQTEEADQVWRAVMDLRQAITPEAAFPYIEYLIAEGQVSRARASWEQLVRRDETLRGYLSPGNLVSNPGFEEDILNGGFSWRYDSDPHVALAIDQREAYRGRRSLSVSFDGEPVRDAHIGQLLAVDPDTTYQFSAWAKTDNIEGAGGPRLAVLDAYSGQTLYLSDEFTGTAAWRQVAGEFHTARDARLAMVRIVRVPGTTRLRGRMWLDEVSVSRK